MEEVFKRILDKLTGADFWIGLGFLAVGITLWLLIGTTGTREEKVLRRQIGVALILVILAGCAMAMNHLFFIREPVFSKNLTGILVMRIVGDDALDSLQGDLIEHLNADLQNDPAGAQIEVHAGTETVDDDQGLADAHKHARAVGQRANAQLVIWGRKIGEKQYFSRITIVAAPKEWRAATERTSGAQDITELRLPPEVTDEPFYLIDFAAGYSYFDRSDYKEALPYLDGALRRKGASSTELADLEFFTAFCHQSLGAGQKTMTGELEEAIKLYESAGEAYADTDQERWGKIQNNLGNAYDDLPVGDRAGNLQKAIGAFEAALRVFTEKDFRVDWATTENNLGAAYDDLPGGDRAGNLKNAIVAYEAALRVRTEKDFPVDWAQTQNNLGNAYADLPGGDRAGNLQNAIEAYEAALRVRTEKDFPVDWAQTQNNLGTAYAYLPGGDRAGNLKNAIEAYEAALRDFTEKDFPVDWAGTENNLGAAYDDLPDGDRAGNLQKAIEAYEAALRVFTEKDFPVDWAMTQNNLGLAYYKLPGGDREVSLQNGIEAYEAALRVRTEKDFPFDWARTQYNLGLLFAKQSIGNRIENLRKAKVCFESALRVWSEDGFPDDHRDAASNLADVEQEMRQLEAKKQK